MATNEDELIIDEQEGTEDEPKPADPKGLRAFAERKAAEAKAASEENAQLKAQIAENERKEKLSTHMDTLGIPAQDRARFSTLASKMIEGDLELDKIRSLASDYNFLAADPQAVAEAERIANASATHVGAQIPAPSTQQEYAKRISEAKTPDEVIALARQAGMEVVD